MKKEAFNKKEIVKTMTYIEALEKGLIDYEDIDDFIDEWHDGDSKLNIDEFLGMNRNQYFNYLKNHEKGLREMFKRGINK